MRIELNGHIRTAVGSWGSLRSVRRREYRNVLRQAQMKREPFSSQLEVIFNSLCN